MKWLPSWQGRDGLNNGTEKAAVALMKVRAL